MVHLKVSEIERAAGALSPDRREEAVRAIREEGFVVLEGLIDPEHVAILRERMLEDVKLLLARPDRPFNWNPGNVQQNPPPFPPYLFRDVMVNDVVIDVTKRVLGKGVKNAFYSGNTAMPSDQRQPVHADIGQLWPELEVAHPAYALVVNIPLVDVSERNGSTEIWPGTHKDTTIAMQDGEITLPEERLEAQRRIAPPIQPEIPAGSFLIRDIRMWHAGMPNHTDQPRPMIAMIHHVGWFPTQPLQFPKGSESIFEHPDLYTHAEYVDGPIDHISQPQAYAYEEAK